MQPLKLLNLAHMGMLLGLLLCLGAVFLAYGLKDSLSLHALVLAHMSLIPFATLLKFSYIARLAALKQLGRPVN